MCSQFFFIDFASTLFGLGLATVLRSWWAMAQRRTDGRRSLPDPSVRSGIPQPRAAC